MADTSRIKPDFAVHLDGNKLQGEEAAAITGIRVFQTRFGASAFEIVVSDQDLKWQGKPTFTECKEVKIELGVPGKLKKVFDGEVTAWRTELERAGPTVMVVRGLDRSHRMMRAQKTKTYQNATPLDCAQQIAGQYGLTAKTRAGSPAPVKMFRFQANQTDFEFLRSMADLEGYMFWVEGNDLHFERPALSGTDDCEFSFGEDLMTFLPSANFRKPAVSVQVGAWNSDGKAEITGKAKKGQELWTVPGGNPGADQARFTSSKTELSLVESRVSTQAHADTVAKAALTKRAMEFLTAEVEVQGDPRVRPGAMVNIKKVGVYSGHYLVTEANHFYDAAGYDCIFYVARDKWGNSSSAAQQQAARQQQGQAAGAQARGKAGAAAPARTKAPAGGPARTAAGGGSGAAGGAAPGAPAAGAAQAPAPGATQPSQNPARPPRTTALASNRFWGEGIAAKVALELKSANKFDTLEHADDSVDTILSEGPGFVSERFQLLFGSPDPVLDAPPDLPGIWPRGYSQAAFVQRIARGQGVGNCGVKAFTAAYDLVGKDLYPVEVIMLRDRDHGFAVVGREPGSNAADPTSWGPNAFVVDPWYNESYPASQIAQHMNNGGKVPVTELSATLRNSPNP